MFDTSRLGAWAELPFWADDMPRIEEALGGQDVLPPPGRTFAALELCQPGATRVVILGQDPYHTPGKADGLAFSIPRNFGGRLDSLGNIFRELEADLGAARRDTDLTDWARQGVLLLNTALTVPPGRPKAHARLGWTRLVEQVLERLDDAPRAILLWGGPAQGFARHLTRDDHLVIATAHPSPLSAHRGFFGARPFSRVNDWLVAQGSDPIRWAPSPLSMRAGQG